MINKTYQKLNTDLRQVLSSQKYTWLQSSLNRLEKSDDLTNELLSLSAMTRRKLGDDRLGAEIDNFLLNNNDILPIQHWTFSDAGRVLLILKSILSTASQTQTQTQTLIRSYYQQGDETEIAAITRALILLGQNDEYKTYALEVGRTNSKPLFSAIAHNNPYPATYYSDHEFNQLVLKALFMDIGIHQILGLLNRASPDLSRMCEDYIKERTAANRSIPSDIWLALEPFASSYGDSQLMSHLKNDNPEQRYYVIKALKQQHPIPPERTKLINDHLQSEKNETILDMLDIRN